MTYDSTLSKISTMDTFGKIFRDKRRESGLSQRQLAELAGVDFSYISKIENDRLPPPAGKTIMRFAEIIGCSSEELFAAAKKIPNEVGDTLSNQPDALRFLKEALEMKLSQDEWESLSENLKGLRSPMDDEKGL